MEQPPPQPPQPPPQEVQLLGHGACRLASPNSEASPFARMLPGAPHTYNPVALALLSGALGPMQSRGRGDRGMKPRIPSGFTFILQLIDHDMTEQVGNALSLGQRQVVAPEGVPTALNGRTGRIDLDSLYGAIGRRGLSTQGLFDPSGRFILGKVMREKSGNPRDIERGSDFGDGRRLAEVRYVLDTKLSFLLLMEVSPIQREFTGGLLSY